MANYFFAINRGLDGAQSVNIVQAGTSTAAADFELRVAAVDAQGNVPTRKDVQLALDAFERLFDASGAMPDGTTFPPL